MSRALLASQKIKAVGLDTRTALENTQLDYAPLATLVQANINGQRLASTALDEMQGHCADPDTLYLALKTIMPTSRDIEALTTMRGFMRILQKRIERTAEA